MLLPDWLLLVWDEVWLLDPEVRCVLQLPPEDCSRSASRAWEADWLAPDVCCVLLLELPEDCSRRASRPWEADGPWAPEAYAC